MEVFKWVVFLCCVTVSICGFSQNMRDKESKEIAYLIDGVKGNKKLDGLIEWKKSSKDDKMISFAFKDLLVFFTFYNESNKEYLQSIDYYHKSFQKMIFIDQGSGEYIINDQTRFGVWMSKDKVSTYFCVISPEKLLIWVLSNGNEVYLVEK